MIPLQILFITLAAICFFLVAIGIPASRINLTGLGLTFYMVAILLRF